MKPVVGLALMLSIFLSACKDEGNRIEVSSATNGMSISARVFRTDFGATVSDQYEIWLSDSQGAMTKKKILFADKVESIHVRWASGDTLMICYAKAQIHEFSNYMLSLKSDGSVLHEIQVDIFRGSDRCALPAAGSTT